MVDEKQHPMDEEQQDEREEQEIEETTAVDVDQAPLEVTSLDEDDTEEPEIPSPEEETRVDFLVEDAREDKYTEHVGRHSAEEGVQETFEERQQYDLGEEALQEKLDQHTSKSPEITGGDVDAAWEDADQAGDEAVGGTSPTPDQDVVDELGEALGIQYEDDEPLNTEEKLRQRDRDRWELDPASAEDFEEEEEEE